MFFSEKKLSRINVIEKVPRYQMCDVHKFKFFSFALENVSVLQFVFKFKIFITVDIHNTKVLTSG